MKVKLLFLLVFVAAIAVAAYLLLQRDGTVRVADIEYSGSFNLPTASGLSLANLNSDVLLAISFEMKNFAPLFSSDGDYFAKS